MSSTDHAAPQPVNYDALVGALKQASTMPSNLPQVARGLAGQDVAASVSGIRAQQQQIGLDAAARAHQLGTAALATAKYLASLHLPGAAARDYAQSAAAERAAAAGYSGGLQQTVGDAAAQVNANLARVGAPGQAENNSAAAGNVLYGLGGNLPASTLDVVGPTVAASYRALPSQTLAYGQAEAQGALGAGQQESAKLNPSIVAAQAQRSSLAASYLSKLQKDAEDRGQHAFANILGVLKVQQADQAAQSLSAYRTAEIGNAQASAQALADYRAGQLGISQQNADTSTYRAEHPYHAPRGPVSVSPGSTLIDPNTGQVLYKAPPKPGGSGGLSASSSAVATRSLGHDVTGWATGKPPQYHYPPGGGLPEAVPGTGVPPVPYQQAVAQAFSAYPNLTPKAVLSIVQSHYPLPKQNQDGTFNTAVAYRPFSGSQAVKIATEAARSGFNLGKDPSTVTDALRSLNVLPEPAIQKAIATVFKAVPISAVPWLNQPGAPPAVKKTTRTAPVSLAPQGRSPIPLPPPPSFVTGG